MTFTKIIWRIKTLYARFFSRKSKRYILSFPERFSPYDRRYKYFNCVYYSDDLDFHYTFSFSECMKLKKELENKKGGAEFWDLELIPVVLSDKKRMKFKVEHS